MIGPHVFGDDRLGLWVMGRENPTELTDKLRHLVSVLPSLKPGHVTDLFLPRTAQPADMAFVKQSASFFAHLWATPHGLGAAAFVTQVVSDIARLKPGAVELNIELEDDELTPYISLVHRALRTSKSGLRLRFNVVPFKSALIPLHVFDHPQTFIIAQTYLGNMDMRVSEADVLLDLLDAGIPKERCSVMYGAHCSLEPGKPRVPALPGWIRRRGSIYSDDLLLDAGYV